MDPLRAYTPARIMRRRDVGNIDIRREVVKQARNVATTVRWPVMPDRADVPAMLHRYLVEHVPYREQETVQSIRRPAALVAGAMDADCKSTAVFAAGLAAAAGCEAIVRFAQYPGTDWFSHVYAIIDGTVCDPLLPFGTEQAYISREDHPISMELEVIQGPRRGRIGEVITTYHSPSELNAQCNNWKLNAVFKAPDGFGGMRVRWWPFKGVTELAQRAYWMANCWPGSLFGVRLLAEQEVNPSFAFTGNSDRDYWYFTQAQADQSLVQLQAWLDQHVRNRLGLAPDDPVPDAAWYEKTIPFTREANGVFGNLLDTIAEFFQRLNPVMVAGRAAFLSLVKANYRGLARKMAANEPSRVRAKWENWGGNWATLRRAIEEGSGQPVGVLPAFVIPALAAGGGGGGKPDNDQSGGNGFGALVAAARPIIDAILSILGIALDDPNDDEAAADAAADGQEGTDITNEVDSHANGEGGGGGGAVFALVGFGLLAAGALSSTANRRRRRKK